MGGETEDSVSAWTIDSLKEYLESVIASLKELIEQRFAAAEKAVAAASAASAAASDKLAITAEKWRENANEWRGAMTDRERDFLRSDSYNRAHEDLVKRVESMNRTLTEKLDDTRKALNDKIDTLAARVSEISAVTG